MTEKTYLVENLEELIEHSGKTATAIAKELGLGSAAITKILTGVTLNPHIRTKKALADFFKVPMHMLDKKNLGRASRDLEYHSSPITSVVRDLEGLPDEDRTAIAEAVHAFAKCKMRR